MTDYDLSRTRSSLAEWRGLTVIRSGAEILLGISFLTAMAFGGIGAVLHQTSIVAELAAIVFLCSLVAVLVNWFSAVEDEDGHEHKGWD